MQHNNTSGQKQCPVRHLARLLEKCPHVDQTQACTGVTHRDHGGALADEAAEEVGVVEGVVAEVEGHAVPEKEQGH